MSNYIQTYSTNPIPKTLTTPFTYTAMPGDGTGGQWYLNQYQDPSNPALSLYDAEGVFDSVTITVGSIPEPTTWAMMLIGFVGLGIAGYRRTREARFGRGLIVGNIENRVGAREAGRQEFKTS